MTHHRAIADRPRARRVRAPVEISRSKPIEFEPHVLRPEDCADQAAQPEPSKARSRVFKYALAAVFGVAGLYLLSTASLMVLGVLGVAFAAVVAFLVSVCIYAQNNTLL